MKKLAKVLSLALVLVMVLSLGGTAWAVGSLTIKDSEPNRKYYAYQIFAGDLSGTTLSNITWGGGINGDNFLAALKTNEAFLIHNPAHESDPSEPETINAFNAASTAADVANILGKEFGSNADAAAAFAKLAASNKTETKIGPAEPATGGYQFSSLDDGYYLVIDETPLDSDGSDDELENDSYSRYIASIPTTTEIVAKKSKPTVEKKVDDKNDSKTDEDNINWEDTADYDIGDHVPFQVTANLPAGVMTGYTKYHLKFADTPTHLAKGSGDTANVYAVIGDKWYDITANANVESAPTIDIANLLAVTEGKLVTFDTTDTEKIASTAADNTTIEIKSATKIVARYTLTLQADAQIGNPGNPNTVHLEYSNNPNADGEGMTPDDTVVVFTYKLDVDKIAKNTAGNAYEAKAGAGFTLYKKQTVAPTEADLTAHPACTVTGYNNYYQVKTYAAGETTNFEFTGLDDGDYVLVETTTPTGYNTMTPLSFTISSTIAANATAVNGYEITALSGPAGFAASPNGGSFTFTRMKVDGTGNEEVTEKIDGTTTLVTGEIFGQIINESGNVLPSTGGVGTTLFYVFGSMLVIAAAVYFVTKKRSEVE